MENLKEKLSELIVLDFKINSEYKRITKNPHGSIKDFQNLFKLSAEFVSLKREFRKDISLSTTITLPDDSERKFLNKLVDNKDFLGNIILKTIYEINKEENDLDKYDISELDEISEDLFSSYVQSYEYAEALIKIGVLISPIAIPFSVQNFVDEARQCYAFYRHNAVYSLCRTIIEAAMRDIGVKIGKIDQSVSDHDFYKEYPPRKLMNATSYGALKVKLHSIYSELSSLIHGYNTIDSKTARKTLKATLQLVQELYEKNEKRMKK